MSVLFVFDLSDTEDGYQRQRCADTLKAIHDNGYLHGGISKENILVSDSGLLITGLGSARRTKSEEEKLEELNSLMILLGLDPRDQFQ